MCGRCGGSGIPKWYVLCNDAIVPERKYGFKGQRNKKTGVWKLLFSFLIMDIQGGLVPHVPRLWGKVGDGTYWRQTPSDILATRHIGDRSKSRHIGDTHSRRIGDSITFLGRGEGRGRVTLSNCCRRHNGELTHWRKNTRSVIRVDPSKWRKNFKI